MLKCYGWVLVRTEILSAHLPFCAFRCTFVSRIFVVCHCSLSCIVYAHPWFCFYLSFYFPPWSFCFEEWCVLRTVCFPFRYCIFFLRRDASVLMVFFCTQGRISVRLLHAPGTKCAAEISMSIFFFAGFSTAHLEMLWSMWIAFVPLLNCTIFRSYIFFLCNLSWWRSCLKHVFAWWSSEQTRCTTFINTLRYYTQLFYTVP